MKTKILILLLFGWVGVVFGQDENSRRRDIAQKYKFTIDSIMSTYGDGRVIQNKALSKHFDAICQAIIPNSQALNNNTSSFSYIQSDDNQKLSLSTAYQFPSYKRTFLNIGISTEGKDGLFNIYSSKSWSNNTSLTIGFSQAFWSSLPYLSKNIKEIKLFEKRKAYADSLSATLQYIALLDKKELEMKKNEFTNKLNKLNDASLVSGYVNIKYEDSISAYTKEIKYYEQKLEEHNMLEKQFNEKKVVGSIEDKFSDFDFNYDKNIFRGYDFFWGQITSKFSNNTYNFKHLNDDSKTESINAFHFNVNGSFMWNRVNESSIHFGTLGASAFRGSFLSDPSLRGISPVINDEDIINDNVIIGNVTDLRKPLWQYSFNAYYAGFYFFDEHLGLSMSLMYNNAFKKGIAMTRDYKENYTISVGPIFKMKGEDNWSKSTFGISIGYDNLPSKERAKDYFAVKAYIGIPFNVFQKKDKK